MQTAERLLLRPEQTADACGVSRAKVYQLIASGEIPSITIGRCRRVPVDALKDWIARQMVEQGR